MVFILPPAFDVEYHTCRGGSRVAAISKMERFVKIVNGCKPLTIITKRSILDVAAVLDPPLTKKLKICFTQTFLKTNYKLNGGFYLCCKMIKSGSNYVKITHFNDFIDGTHHFL